MDNQITVMQVLAALSDRRDLADEQVRCMMESLMTGSCGEAEAAEFLIGMRAKGETAEEIAAAAAVLREHMVRWDPGRSQVLDTCGTGGDGARTFNISTAAAFVVAAAGVPVVKHGNRAVSSFSGSADVLGALGLPCNGEARHARACLDETGLAFCYAPQFHPALAKLAPLRRRLGVVTLFNCLGPLANPAGACFQLIGVGRPEWLDGVARALARLGTVHALVVHGRDGLDEVSLSATTDVREVRGQYIRSWEWNPADFGLEPCTLADLYADSALASADVVRQVLGGREGPATRIVLANAAAALFAADKVGCVAEGVVLAREAISSGRARDVLEKLRRA